VEQYSLNNETELENHNPYLAMLSKIIFPLYLFFIFFGTSLPFRGRTREIASISTSNLATQIIFGSLFIISILLLLFKKQDMVRLIKREKYFFIFLLWCMLTIVWSENSFVSFKRYIQYLTTVTVPLSFLLYIEDSDESLKYFYYILGIYVLVSLAAIFAIPMARNNQGFWRGIHTDKNGFGQISIVLTIFFSMQFVKSDSLKSKAIDLFFILASIMLVVGSRSSTALITLLVLIAIWIAFYIDKLFNPIGVRKTISLIILFFSSSILMIILILYPGILGSVMGTIGKDLTFTGRIDIWNDIWNEAQKHLFIGAGFRGFWIIDSPNLIEFYQKYIWLPQSSHNGYIDILNEVGVIGSALFLLTLINYFVNLTQTKSSQLWKWFVIAAIILNFSESKFINPKSVTGVMLIFSYLVLFTDLMKEEILETRRNIAGNEILNKKFAFLKRH